MLIYRYIHRVRGDTVCHYNESTWSSLHSSRYIEMRERGDTAGSYRHGAVVVGLGVENMSGGDILDPHQWVICGGLIFVTVPSRL